MEQGFTEKDIEQLDEFGKLINDKATWNLSTADVIKVYKGLLFINSTRKKIADNILEYRRILQDVEPVKQKRKAKSDSEQQ